MIFKIPKKNLAKNYSLSKGKIRSADAEDVSNVLNFLKIRRIFEKFPSCDKSFSSSAEGAFKYDSTSILIRRLLCFCCDDCVFEKLYLNFLAGFGPGKKDLF